MNGQQVRDARKRQGFTQPQLAVVLTEALGRKVDAHTVGRWERAERKVPKDAEAFLFALNRGDTTDDSPGTATDDGPTVDGPAPGDTAPGGGYGFDGPPPPQAPLTSSGSHVYAAACTELWELAGTTVAMLGAVLGNEKLVIDGQIIDADKQALGEAYGKLAETNETFRRMLVSMTQGGAVMQVAVVTAVTAGKIVQVHLPAPVLEDTGGNGTGDYAAAAAGPPAA